MSFRSCLTSPIFSVHLSAGRLDYSFFPLCCLVHDNRHFIIPLHSNIRRVPLGQIKDSTIIVPKLSNPKHLRRESRMSIQHCSKVVVL